MIPEHLRPHLEQLGAIVTPNKNGGTEVHIPGAYRKFLFTPHGGVAWDAAGGSTDGWRNLREYDSQAYEESQGPPGEYFTDQGTGDFLDRMAWNSEDHVGPTHSLIVSQHALRKPDGIMRLGHSYQFYAGPTNNRVLEAEEEVHPNSKFGQGIAAVLKKEMPIEALVDELADHHGVSEHVKPFPQQFAKVYGSAIKFTSGN